MVGVTSCKKPTSGGAGHRLPETGGSGSPSTNHLINQEAAVPLPTPLPTPPHYPQILSTSFPTWSQEPEGHMDQVWGGSREGEPRRPPGCPDPVLGLKGGPEESKDCFSHLALPSSVSWCPATQYFCHWRQPLARRVPGGLHSTGRNSAKLWDRMPIPLVSLLACLHPVFSTRHGLSRLRWAPPCVPSHAEGRLPEQPCSWASSHLQVPRAPSSLQARGLCLRESRSLPAGPELMPLSPLPF